ncbi:type I restriction endonuclease subunit R [Candidatus Poriferisocius sp.]|uniref:type I restriction endonuclease subunit R n=1 Tax=Candidatus Poriferisocius sp. TaxID=3101276 RepID=UPI003B5232D4
MTSGPEWERVERPLLEHLSSLGWETLIWSERQADGVDARAADRDVFLERRLGEALKEINRGPDGSAWLDEARISAAIAELRSMPAGAKLLEANRLSTDLLLGGTTVEGLDGWDRGRDQVVNHIDWDDWPANDFLAVSQFSVATPGQAPNIRPDVTLFVNGIPLVVIEAKPPGHDSAITDAIDQLRRYANQRDSGANEGAEQLFWTNQLTVATTGERAQAGTFSAEPEHYMAWKDPCPATVDEVAASLGKPADAVTQQELLTAGMLAPERLLDIVRHFTLFTNIGAGRTIKLVGRYQQYRGVQKALRRLLTGDTRAVDGHVDRRGGIIWHTQGSGKSLTMVFLIRAMRSHPQLRSFKIVLVTDRTDLQAQLNSTAALVGETVKVARSAAEVRELLRQPGPAVVMAMIQKYRDTSGDDADGLGEGETFETLNESESILVMVDEAHRSQASTLHANLIDGFKGMIVATSREACLRYFGALNTARDELVIELDQRRNDLLDRSSDSRLLDPEESFLRGAAGQVDLIRALEFAPVISGDHNDPPHYAEWTDKANQEARINSFKSPLGEEGDNRSPLSLLIVKSMLLTGFDAPWAQVLYLDRMIQEAELLQAIARVNRTAPKKTYGLVVDYYGVSSQLTQALAAYAGDDGEIDPDVEGALRPLAAEIEKLEPQRQRVRQIFVQRGIEPAVTVDAIEDCVHLLSDERLRAEFDVALRMFLTTFDTVLPRPEALRFVDDANLFGEIQIATRRRYRDTPDGDFDPLKYKEKVRRLIDEHITVLDLSQKIAPLRITDPDFRSRIKEINSDRAKASEMEHAARHHIREHLDEDPAYYGKLSKRIDEILERLEDRWDQIALEFEELIADINVGRTDEDNTGLDPTTELPFHGQMAEKVASSDPDASDQLIAQTREIVSDIRRTIKTVGFWDNPTKQDELRKAVKRKLDKSDLFDFKSLDELAVELVDLAKANQQRLA